MSAPMYLVGSLRCYECGLEHVAAWRLDAENIEQECDHCGAMAAVPVRARAIEEWPEIAAKIEMSGIREQQALTAKRGVES